MNARERKAGAYPRRVPVERTETVPIYKLKMRSLPLFFSFFLCFRLVMTLAICAVVFVSTFLSRSSFLFGIGTCGEGGRAEMVPRKHLRNRRNRLLRHIVVICGNDHSRGVFPLEADVGNYTLRRACCVHEKNNARVARYYIGAASTITRTARERKGQKGMAVVSVRGYIRNGASPRPGSAAR